MVTDHCQITFIFLIRGFFVVKVSVVIPVYNVEDFLGECLDSICNQTLKDIEIICVNDGSADSTLDIFNDSSPMDTAISINIS